MEQRHIYIVWVIIVQLFFILSMFFIIRVKKDKYRNTHPFLLIYITFTMIINFLYMSMLFLSFHLVTIHQILFLLYSIIKRGGNVI